MPFPPRLARPLLLAAVAALPRIASAHGLDAGRITLELDGPNVFLVATPRSASFATLDDDGDGLLALDEVRAHRPALREAIDDAIVLTDREGRSPVCDTTDVSTPGSGHPGAVSPSDHVRVTRRCRFAGDPDGILLRDAYAVDVPVVVDAYRRGAARGERAVLSGASPTALLASPGAAPAPEPGASDAASVEAADPDDGSLHATDVGVLLGAVLFSGATLLRKTPTTTDRNSRKEQATR
jgi:hypothetical protein